MKYLFLLLVLACGQPQLRNKTVSDKDMRATDSFLYMVEKSTHIVLNNENGHFVTRLGNVRHFYLRNGSIDSSDNFYISFSNIEAEIAYIKP